MTAALYILVGIVIGVLLSICRQAWQHKRAHKQAMKSMMGLLSDPKFNDEIREKHEKINWEEITERLEKSSGWDSAEDRYIYFDPKDKK